MGRLNHKRGRPSNYRKFLKDNPYWKKVRRKVLIRDGFSCVICGAKTKLEVHHTSYKINGVTIVGNELQHLDWIVLLCEEHHNDQHMVPNEPFNPKNPNKLMVSEYKNL